MIDPNTTDANRPGAVVVALGTRPEAIKLAPVIVRLRERGDRVVTVATGQHRDMVASILEAFAVEVDHDLDIMQPDQSPNDVLRRTVETIEPVLRRVSPRLLLVQGDTTSALASALAAFNLRIPVGHVEAGLRSGRSDDPFPEEMNRRLISRLAALHFAPTDGNRQSLLAEGVEPESVHVTGNTVIDALEFIAGMEGEDERVGEILRSVGDRRLLLLTTHRRENFGERQRSIFAGINRLLEERDDIAIVFPVHPNPQVRAAVASTLREHPHLHIISPLDYIPFVRLMSHADLALTDSGGIQEEGPALGLPVLVLRETTERSEAVESGGARMIGTDADAIVRSVNRLLDDRKDHEEMARKRYPFGEAGAAGRIVEVVENGGGNEKGCGSLV